MFFRCFVSGYTTFVPDWILQCVTADTHAGVGRDWAKELKCRPLAVSRVEARDHVHEI
jgi:hypothetical protein